MRTCSTTASLIRRRERSFLSSRVTQKQKKTEKIEKQKKTKKGETPQVWMPEWSKGDDLRSSVFARVGSNPTPDIFFSRF